MMKMMNRHILLMAVSVILASCGMDTERNYQPDGGTVPIQIGATVTRADDSGFADKDNIGVYIVDYKGTEAGVLKNSGNRADNVQFTFDKASWKWIPSRDIYWKDKETHIDVYGYYPYNSVTDVNAYAVEVSKDQSVRTADGKTPAYEASDFLWGKVEDVAQTDKVIMLPFTHRMAKIKVTLDEGSGFKEGEWGQAEKSVIISNTRRKASINLATGEADAVGDVSKAGIIPVKDGQDFKAIVVPQEIQAGTTLLNITVAGVPYRFSINEKLTLTASRQHNFTIKVNKKSSGDFEFVPQGEGITAWEEDDTGKDVTTREYIVVNVNEPGSLDRCIEESGKDIAKIKNLKLTGKINARDFALIRLRMKALQALNLKEVQIKASSEGFLGDDYDYNNHYIGGDDDEMPEYALANTKDLLHLVLPDRLKTIEEYSLINSGIAGPLVIPEGVTRIGANAFHRCTSIGRLSLPESLTYIGDAAFAYSSITGKLSLPRNVEYIGEIAFQDCNSIYGELHLPDKLTYMGRSAFNSITGLTGSLSIPEGVKEIKPYVFHNCPGLNGTLTLHDGITKIDDGAFAYCSFRGELVLPKDLTVINDEAFFDCRFSGSLSLPDNLTRIGANAFGRNSKLSGTIELPESLVSIGAYAFIDCEGIEGVILPEECETVPNGIFMNCHNIRSIVCKSEIPPEIGLESFAGVPKDNFTVEVPESSVHQYQVASGWSDFKRISAYRKLVIRPRVATALNTKVKRSLTLNADEEWFVESQPSWVKISQTEGKGRTDLTLEFMEMPHGENREGEVVFKLKDKDYRTTCQVSQYDYEQPEDQIVTLQKASKGKGVNLVFLGDGYNARDIHDGMLTKDIEAAVGHFFSIEPYKTYKEYFNVYTGIAVSQESGIGGINTVVYNRFGTTSKGGAMIGCRNDGDFLSIFEYATLAPTIDESDLPRTLIVMIPNTDECEGSSYLYEDGSAIVYCPTGGMDDEDGFRGVIQHEAGGHGFGKLGDETVYINAFADNQALHSIDEMNAKGWYANLSTTGKPNEVTWHHLIEDERYNSIVDVFEGGYSFTRGVYRSEYNSCMNNNIPYLNAISREAIVRRIMEYAGLEFNFDDFVANDKIENLPETASLATKAHAAASRPSVRCNGPVFMGNRPQIM